MLFGVHNSEDKRYFTSIGAFYENDGVNLGAKFIGTAEEANV